MRWLHDLPADARERLDEVLRSYEPKRDYNADWRVRRRDSRYRRQRRQREREQA